MNLIVSSFEYRADGTVKFGVDLGFVKGSYEELPGHKGWRVEAGSGPVDVFYEEGDKGPQKQRHLRGGLGPPGGGPGGDDYKVGVTVGVTASKFVPGVLKPLAGAADEVLSVGAKGSLTWGNKTGVKGGVSTEAKFKAEIKTINTPNPSTSLQN